MSTFFWVVIALLVVQLGFSGSNIVIKAGGKDANLHPLIFSMLRDIFAFPVLMAAAAFFEGYRLPKREDMPLILLLGLTGAFGNQFLFINGLYLTNPTIASIFQPTVPVITAFLAVMVGMEKLDLDKGNGRAKVVGALCASFGAIIIVLAHQPEEHSRKEEVNNGSFFLGVLCLIGNCTCTAAYVLLQKKYVFNKEPEEIIDLHSITSTAAAASRRGGLYNYHFHNKARFPPIHVTAWMYGVGSAVMGLCSMYFVLTGELDVFAVPVSSIGPLLYVVFITSSTCYGLLSWANKHSSPTLVTSFWPLQVPGVAFLSYIFFDELLSATDALGAVLIIAGLLSVTLSHRFEERRGTIRAKEAEEEEYA